MLNTLKRWLGLGLLPPKAIELKRGALYAIECTETLTLESFTEISDYLETVKEKTGCDFVILDRGFKLVLKGR